MEKYKVGKDGNLWYCAKVKGKEILDICYGVTFGQLMFVASEWFAPEEA